MPRASFCLKIKNPEYGQARDQAQPSAVVDHTPTRFGYAQGNGSGTGVESLLRSDPSCKPLIFLLAPVAQRIRASDFGSEGWGFESLRARYSRKGFRGGAVREKPLVAIWSPDRQSYASRQPWQLAPEKGLT